MRREGDRCAGQRAGFRLTPVRSGCAANRRLPPHTTPPDQTSCPTALLQPKNQVRTRRIIQRRGAWAGLRLQIQSEATGSDPDGGPGCIDG